jgi:hypothetical protein
VTQNVWSNSQQNGLRDLLNVFALIALVKIQGCVIKQNLAGYFYLYLAREESMSLYKNGLFSYPIYLAAKALINTNNDRFNVTCALGIGPNFMQASNQLTNTLNTGNIYANALIISIST